MLKSYIIYINLFILVASPVLGMSHFQRHVTQDQVYSNYASDQTDNDSKQEDEQKAKEEEERKRLEELRSHLEGAAQQEESEKEKLAVETHDGLTLLHNKDEKRATAIFQIPDQSKVYDLTDQERERIKELFKVCSVENHGEYKVVKFQYKNVELLPQNREQAIYLLYSPYVKNKLIQSSSDLKSPLNEIQKNVLDSIKKEKKLTFDIEKKTVFIQELKKRIEDANKKKQEGIFGTTRVKTNRGYCTIEELKVGDLVACYDFKNKKEIYSSITYADKFRVASHIQIIINSEIIQVAPEHKFYIAPSDLWVKAKDLINNPDLVLLLDPNIYEVKEVKEELDVIRISVNDQQNYYITNNNLLVHNFLLLDVSILWGIGEGIEITWAVLGPTLAAAATGFVYWIASRFCDVDKASHVNKPNHGLPDFRNEANTDIFFKADNLSPQNSKQSSDRSASGKPNKDPEKDNERKQHTHITNKEADKAAEELGFQKTNEYSQGRPIYKKESRYITPDQTSHNGGFWKMANSVKNLADKTTRLGTFNKDLSIKIGN